MLTIQFEKREKAGSFNTMKEGGKIPAVFYGPKETTTSIAIKENEFKKVWKEAGESSIIILKGEGEEHEVLIHEVDRHPVTGFPRHADFYVIEKGKKLEIKVPIEFMGVSGAVKDLGGTLVKVLHEVEIEALPKDLPRELTVDISLLSALDSQILAKDIKLPSGVELKINPEDVVAAIAVAKEEEEEVKTLDVDAIELVDQKGKEPGEADGEAAASEDK